MISKVYNGSTTAIVTKQSGNGMTDNRLFIPQGTYFGGVQDNTTCTTDQYDKCTNSQLQQRLGRSSRCWGIHLSATSAISAHTT